jgi:hypothetical protein
MASPSAGWVFLRPGIDGIDTFGIAGIETLGIAGIDTEGIETEGRLVGSHPETFPVTFENIPPDALVGLRRSNKRKIDFIQSKKGKLRREKLEARECKLHHQLALFTFLLVSLSLFHIQHQQTSHSIFISVYSYPPHIFRSSPSSPFLGLLIYREKGSEGRRRKADVHFKSFQCYFAPAFLLAEIQKICLSMH